MKVMLFANSDWYLYNFRRSLALAVKGAGHEVVLVSPGGPYSCRLQQLGLRWVALEMSRKGTNPLGEALVVNRLREILLREDVDVLHNFTLKSAICGSIASRLTRVNAVVNSVTGMGHSFSGSGLSVWALRQVLCRAVIPFAIMRADRLILQNCDDAALFRSLYPKSAQKVRLVLGSGVDCGRFRPSPGHREPSGLRVLMAARLIRQKGVGDFAEAARRLRADGRRIDFLLAGELDPSNPDAISEKELRQMSGGVVRWLGKVEDMAELLQSVDIFALPSYYGEGLPKVLIEAAATGLPLITTDHPGCREVVDDNQNGILIPPRSPEALASAIARLHDHALLRAHFGHVSRSRALKEFDEGRVIRQTMEIYEEVVAPRVRQLGVGGAGLEPPPTLEV